MWKELIARHFTQGRYSKNDVKVFVKAGRLTPEEYAEVTGEDYAE